MKWTKFSSGEYPKTSPVWITNHKEVWIDHDTDQDNWEGVNKNWLWAEIPIPEVPKGELHCCSTDWMCCKQDAESLYITHICGHSDGGITHMTSCRVPICPICGYSIKEKECPS